MLSALKKEKGIALVIAMMLLLVMSVMVAGFMLTITTEQKLGGNQNTYTSALNAAEAGISELSARLSLTGSSPYYIGEGDVVHPDWQARIVNNTSIPTAPANSNIDYYSSLQASLNDTLQLPYTVSTVNTADSVYVLTARYKTEINGTDTTIYYYNHATGERIAVASPYGAPNDKSTPIWVIRSTGIRGNVRRSLEVEVSKILFDCNVKASLQTNADIFFRGRGGVCGHNHPVSLWHSTGQPDAGASLTGGGGLPYCHSPRGLYELCNPPSVTDDDAGCLPGIATSPGATLKGPQGGAVSNGEPPTAGNVTYQPIWNMLGFADSISMKTAYGFLPAITDPTTVSPTDFQGKALEFDCDVDISALNLTANPSGIWWLKKGFKAAGGNNVYFKGIFVVEGGMHISGQFWVLGAMVCNGDIVLGNPSGGPNPVNLTGQIDVLYSSEAIQDVLSQTSSSAGLKQLSWREVNIH
ncbi:MAG: pilus assembly PilX N-terminal domain-containing protein [Candidatus Edwardsbacteria bacterium]|nr:pilus assembly PilX N-terminal domain-containing protein [Candidatus Edwardsbacteria bacterium]